MKEKPRKTGIAQYSCVMPYFVLTVRRQTASAAWKFIGTIIKDFFLLQTAQKLHLTHRPVLNVETEIDGHIPFSPEHVKPYISFVAYFVRPISMLIKELGYKTAAAYVNRFLALLTDIYRNASIVYRHCMTTTSRPRYLKGMAFISIHLFDPHLLCVPSIHVSIAAGVWKFFKMIFSEPELIALLPQQKREEIMCDIERQGFEIMESVLFVKQHSVNCVPTALYMLTSIFPADFFSPQDASFVIERLFKKSSEISDDDKKAISEHFHYMYERVFLESIYADNWQECIFHWMDDWAASTGQLTNAVLDRKS